MRVFVQQADCRQMNATFPACFPGRAQDARDPGPRRRRPGALVTTRNLRQDDARGMAAGGHGSPLPRPFGGEGRGRRSCRPRVRGGRLLGAKSNQRDQLLGCLRSNWPPLTLTLSPRAPNALGGEGRVAGGDNTGVILGLVPRTHRAASMVAAVGVRRAALPGRRPFPRGAMGPRAKPEDDDGGEVAVAALSPALRGRGQRPASLPAEGEGRPLATALNPTSVIKCWVTFGANSRPSP